MSGGSARPAYLSARRPVRAAVYSGGESEAIVGEWLAAGGPARRRAMVVATKVRFPAPGAKGPNGLGLSRGHVLDSVADSLGRLGTGHVDLLLTHAWDEGTPVEETARAVATLIEAGQVRYWGVSNVTGWQLMKVLAECDRLSVPRPVCVQAQYSLLCRETEWEVAACCRAEGVALLPWSPLKGGWLAGKMTREGAPEGSRAAWADSDKGTKLQSSPGHSDFAGRDEVWALLDGMRAAAGREGRSVAQVALSWLLTRDTVPCVVIGAKRPSQLADNLGAGRAWRLSADDASALEALSDAVVGRLPYPYEMVFRVQAGRKRG